MMASLGNFETLNFQTLGEIGDSENGGSLPFRVPFPVPFGVPFGVPFPVPSITIRENRSCP